MSEAPPATFKHREARPMDRDDELMQAVANGDSGAFDELFARHRQAVFGFLWARLGDYHTAEDLTQAVFLRVLKERRRYNPEGRFTSWIFTIARNLTLDHLRSQARHPTVRSDATSALRNRRSDERDPRDLAMAAEDANAVHRALAMLPEPQREALELRRFSGLSFSEIAKIQGQSVSGAKMRVFRGMAKLREILAPHVEEAES